MGPAIAGALVALVAGIVSVGAWARRRAREQAEAWEGHEAPAGAKSHARNPGFLSVFGLGLKGSHPGQPP